MHLHRQRPRVRLVASALAVAALVAGIPTRAGTPTYRIDYHVISAGASAMRSTHCYGLLGTVGQTAPGYSSASTYSIVGGFWTGDISASDDIFYNGFEGC